MHKSYSTLALIASIMAVFGCKKEFEGDKFARINPETYFSVDSIYRSGEERLTTTVLAHWWGVSEQGYIKGFEVSTDNQATWRFTTAQSETLLLTIPEGADTADIKVFVRAIDNLGNTDPTPAGLTYPVKNTPPQISFDFSQGRKTKLFPAFRYAWVATDVDNVNDISAIEIAFNDTTKLVALPPTASAASFVAEQLNGNVLNTCQIYLNNQTTPYQQKIDNLKLNQLNYIWLRSKDRSGAKSNWKKDSIFIKNPQASRIVLINDYSSNRNFITTFYSTRIRNLGTSYQLFDTIISITNELPTDAFTTLKTFEFFKKMVWATDDPTKSLGTAQLTTLPFFNANGKLFMVLEIPNDVAPDASFFNFTPIEKLVVDPGRSFRMSSGDLVTAYQAGWPQLKATSIITLPRPYFTYTVSTGVFAYDSLCRADVRSFGPGGAPPWTGPSNVMSKRINLQKNKPDFITLTVPMHQVNGNNNIDSFFNKVVIGELEF